MASNSSSSTRPTAAEVQGRIVDLIAEALGVAPGEIDVEAPLADQGIDSIAALQLVGELEIMLDRPLEATLLFEHPTIATLARYLQS